MQTLESWQGTSDKLESGCLVGPKQGWHWVPAVEPDGRPGRQLRERLRIDSSLRLLVADDDAGFLCLLSEAVAEFSHYSSAPALLAQAAVARSKSQEAPWDVALISLDLPRFEGLIAITRLRDSFPTLRIVATTEVADTDVLTTATYAGADEHLVKRDLSSILPQPLWVSIGAETPDPLALP
jgi:CheY-like chemotaxis protein